MMKARTIEAHFLQNDRYFENSLGSEFHYTQSTGPYEYLLGALAGCFFSTLASFDRSSNWREATIKVEGYKREEVPTTLEKTRLIIKVFGAEDKEEFKLLAKRASEECSIYQTISKVSKMEMEISFED